MLPLIVILLSLCISDTLTARIKYTTYNPKRPFYRRNNEQTDICACFSQGDNRNLVKEHLINHGHTNTQRVVAYFYLDTDTNEITTYIPNVDTQKQFPDLTLHQQDVLEHISESNLFETIKSRVVEVETPEPIHEDNHRHNVDDDHITVEAPINEAVSVTQSVEEPVTESEVTPRPTNAVQPAIVSHTVYHTSAERTSPSTDVVSVTPHTETNPEIHSENNPILIGEVNSTPVNHSISETKYDSYEMPNIPVPEDDGFYSQNQIVYNYPTFEYWFQKQIDKFDITSYQKLLYINNQEFKEALKLTLSRNGITLTDDGYLRGLDGRGIDINKLELRSVWVGDKLNVQNLVSNDQTNLGNSPVLHTVLVSLVYPPRILGIIPLGKAYFNSEAASSNNAVHTSTVTRSRNHINNIGHTHGPVKSIVWLKPSIHQIATKNIPGIKTLIHEQYKSYHNSAPKLSNQDEEIQQIKSFPLSPIPEPIARDSEVSKTRKGGNEQGDNQQIYEQEHQEDYEKDEIASEDDNGLADNENEDYKSGSGDWKPDSSEEKEGNNYLGSNEGSSSKEKDPSSSEYEIIHREDPPNRVKTRNDILKSLIELLQSNSDSEFEYEVGTDDDEPPGIRIIGGKEAIISGSLINNRGRSLRGG